MNSHWTLENVEDNARTELGPDLAIVADLFPRAVNAIYIQMTSEEYKSQSNFNRDEYRRRVLSELPKNCEEVLPFFVRSVWNKRWDPVTHATEIEKLANDFAKVVGHAGGSVSVEELIEECKKSLG